VQETLRRTVEAVDMLTRAIETVLADADQRPGAYLHADIRPLRKALATVQRARVEPEGV